jgi:hypothetical protein
VIGGLPPSLPLTAAATRLRRDFEAPPAAPSQDGHRNGRPWIGQSGCLGIDPAPGVIEGDRTAATDTAARLAPDGDPPAARCTGTVSERVTPSPYPLRHVLCRHGGRVTLGVGFVKGGG